MPDTEIQIASTTEFDSYPDYEARPRDTFTDLAEITATTEGITARFLNGCDDDIYFSCSAEVRAPWPEVLKHAPAEAIAVAVLERQDVLDLIDSATMHNELLDRERRAYRGE